MKENILGKAKAAMEAVKSKVTEFAETIKIGQMKLKNINITLSLIPRISISIS